MGMSDRIAALLDEAAVCRRPLTEAWSLPPALFHDGEWYERERTRLFHGGWVAVCRVSEVSDPNAVVASTIAGNRV